MTKRALIVGRGASVWDDMATALTYGSYDATIVINRVGRDFKEPFQHWVSYHPDLFEHWMKQRREPLPPNIMYWSGVYRGRKLGEVKKANLPIQYCRISGGSSAMLAIKVALDGIGMDKAVLVGCPLDNSPRYDDPTPWKEGVVYREQWGKEKSWIGDRVRSLSGWTRELFGPISEEWFR